MDWITAMNHAVDYLEANLTEKLDIEKVANIALSSSFHFQRMYYMLTGVTVAEYVRRRRLTLAAQDILAGEKIIDVAYKYGYKTPESFTKAFRKLHGISPSVARGPGIKLMAYPKLSFHISIKGDKNMNYKIVEKESFTVVGKQTRITAVNGENFEQVPKFWSQCMNDGSYDWICSRASELGVLGVSMDLHHFNQGFFTYMIGLETPGESLPQGFTTVIIPKATWAVFESIGPLPGAIQDITRRIFTEWFPSTGYQHDCAPELEVYSAGDIYAPDYRCEVWVPIRK